MARLQNKNIVVIGGATGIGKRASLMMADEGATVLVGDVNLDGAEAVAGEAKARGREVDGLHVDLASEDSIVSFLERAIERLGTIDGLFLNAAAVDADSVARDTDIVSIDMAHWDKVMTVNLRGYVLAARHAIPLMLKGGGGSIVCTSSELSFIASGCKVMPGYCMSKAGVNVLICHIASQFGRDGIRCNGIAPGYIDVGRTSGSREKYGALVCVPELGIPDDIGSAVIHLMTDESRYIQGQMLSVNGGSLFR